jgi:hypothetical protein
VNDDARRRHDQMRKAAGGKGKPPPKKAPARAVVAHACGHKVGLAQLESQDCPACVGARRRAHNRERYDSMGLPKGEKFRLPHKTSFEAEYDDERGVWSGGMYLYLLPRDSLRTDNFPDKAFLGEDADGERLQRKLGKMAREWLKAREGGGA